jgi:hypothetical protein
MLSALGRITPSANPPYDLPADHYFTFADYCAAALSAREISIEDIDDGSRGPGAHDGGTCRTK